MNLSAKEKKQLRSLGHHLKPEVWIGKEGISSGAIHTLQNSFHTKELVKIKVLENCPLQKDDIAQQLSDATAAEIIQILGNMILLYRPLPEEEE